MLIAEAIQDQPTTHLQVVKAPRKARKRKPNPLESHPFAAIGVPLVSRRGNVWWQLTLNFKMKLEPIPTSRTTTSFKPSSEETQEQRMTREAKGIADRDKFMKEVGDPAKYQNMRFMAKKFIMKALNKSSTMRGLDRHHEDDLAMEFLHETIDKVARLLETGTKKSDNVCGYCFRFIEMDAKRFVHKLDASNYDIHFDDSGDDDDDLMHRSSSAGRLALSMADIPAYMEGHPKEFAEFVSEFVFDWVGHNMIDNKRMAQDVHIFTLYYHSGQTIKQIKQHLSVTKHRVVAAYESVKNHVLEHVSIQEIQEAFGKKIMEGCNCE